MKYTSDPTLMSEIMLQSELNAFVQLPFMTQDDVDYCKKLQAELDKRIEAECINDTEEV